MTTRTGELLSIMSSTLQAKISQSHDSKIEIVRGGAAVTALTYGAAAAARVESLSLEPRRLVLPGQESAIGEEITLALLARGVAQRVVMAQSLESRADRTVVEALLSSEHPPRYHPDVPLRVLVYDRSRAFIAVDPMNTRAGAYVTSDPDVIEQASQLFWSLWDEGIQPPVTESGRRGADLSHGLCQEVLSALVEGQKDEAIARRLGISTRTVRRVVAQLKVEYGTTSRVQIASLVASTGRARQPEEA